MGKELLSGKGASHFPVVRKFPSGRKLPSGKEASQWERSFPVVRKLPSEKKARWKQNFALGRNSSAGRKVFMFMFRGRPSKRVDLMIRET